jgi:single-strand DNA-binding protein
MAEGMNKVILLGNLGADPELKMTQGGQAILKLRIATTESYKDRDGAWKERTEWHSVTLWGKRGESLSKILAKGDRICVEGGLRTSSYEKDGEKRYRTEINATNVYLCGGRRGAASDGEQQEVPGSRGNGNSNGNGNGGGSSRGRQQQKPTPEPAQDFGDYGGGADDDIPFAFDATRFGRRDRP